MTTSHPLSKEAAQVLEQYGQEYRDLRASLAALDERAAALRDLIERTERLHGIEPGGDGSQLQGAATTRVGAIHELLLASDEPLSLQQIGQMLREQGRPESGKDIASAVSYLRGRGEAVRVGRGLWTAG